MADQIAGVVRFNAEQGERETAKREVKVVEERERMLTGACERAKDPSYVVEDWAARHHHYIEPAAKTELIEKVQFALRSQTTEHLAQMLELQKEHEAARIEILESNLERSSEGSQAVGRDLDAAQGLLAEKDATIAELRSELQKIGVDCFESKATRDATIARLRELLGPCQFVTGAWTDGKGHVNHQTCDRERPCLSHDIRAMVQPALSAIRECK